MLIIVFCKFHVRVGEGIVNTYISLYQMASTLFKQLFTSNIPTYTEFFVNKAVETLLFKNNDMASNIIKRFYKSVKNFYSDDYDPKRKLMNDRMSRFIIFCLRLELHKYSTCCKSDWMLFMLALTQVQKLVSEERSVRTFFVVFCNYVKKGILIKIMYEQIKYHNSL